METAKLKLTIKANEYTYSDIEAWGIGVTSKTKVKHYGIKRFKDGLAPSDENQTYRFIVMPLMARDATFDIECDCYKSITDALMDYREII